MCVDNYEFFVKEDLIFPFCTPSSRDNLTNDVYKVKCDWLAKDDTSYCAAFSTTSFPGIPIWVVWYAVRR